MREATRATEEKYRESVLQYISEEGINGEELMLAFFGYTE